MTPLVSISGGVVGRRGTATRVNAATVIPAKAGIQRLSCERRWGARGSGRACAGTTGVLLLIYGMTAQGRPKGEYRKAQRAGFK